MRATVSTVALRPAIIRAGSAGRAKSSRKVSSEMPSRMTTDWTRRRSTYAVIAVAAALPPGWGGTTAPSWPVPPQGGIQCVAHDVADQVERQRGDEDADPGEGDQPG